MVFIQLETPDAKILQDFAEMLGSCNVANIIGADYDDKVTDDICNVMIDVVEQITGERSDSHVSGGKWIGEAK